MRPLIQVATGFGLCAFLLAGTAAAEQHADHPGHAEHAATADQAAPADQAADEPAAEHGHDAHGHVPHFSDINWATGFLGEKEGVKPSLLWRPVGTPIPLGALLLNTAILFFLIGRFGGAGIKKGLVDRKSRIAGDIERAAAMRADASRQLAHYEGKLSEMESELTRIKAEMEEQARIQRDQILNDARQRRVQIEQEAQRLVVQELAQARHEAVSKAVSGAIAAAREEIQKNLTDKDQEKLSQELLGSLAAHVKKVSEVRS